MQGLRVIVKGLDYHYRNVCDPQIKTNNDVIHEITAYLNRLGQIFFFLKSDFMKTDEKLIPNIYSAIKFRMKHSAHRAVDDPRTEDFLMDITSFPILKPYESLVGVEPEKLRDMSRYKVIVQLSIKDKKGKQEHYNFCVEDEHEQVMKEIELSLEEKIKKLKPKAFDE